MTGCGFAVEVGTETGERMVDVWEFFFRHLSASTPCPILEKLHYPPLQV